MRRKLVQILQTHFSTLFFSAMFNYLCPTSQGQRIKVFTFATSYHTEYQFTWKSFPIMVTSFINSAMKVSLRTIFNLIKFFNNTFLGFGTSPFFWFLIDKFNFVQASVANFPSPDSFDLLYFLFCSSIIFLSVLYDQRVLYSGNAVSFWKSLTSL